MKKSLPPRFTVAPENELAALAHLKQHGFQPAKVEGDSAGMVVLIFAPMTADHMQGLAEALPLHLSTKIGIFLGAEPPPGFLAEKAPPEPFGRRWRALLRSLNGRA